MNFSSKLKISSHAINHPMEPERPSSVNDTVNRMQNIIDKALTKIEYVQMADSPVKRKERNKFNHEKHRSLSILQCLFRSLHRSEEKLSFAVLKLFDLIL